MGDLDNAMIALSVFAFIVAATCLVLLIPCFEICSQQIDARRRKKAEKKQLLYFLNLLQYQPHDNQSKYCTASRLEEDLIAVLNSLNKDMGDLAYGIPVLYILATVVVAFCLLLCKFNPCSENSPPEEFDRLEGETDEQLNRRLGEEAMQELINLYK
ncbi:unnamed protein product [Clavelina lepadiformis]|uniref:Uncharacterized protein n=1 Tax=Clavelina lepadiformis TaxID=159417 RepID=A0ABP0FRR8_CLALP